MFSHTFMWRSVLWPPSFNWSSAYSLLGNQLSVISLVLSHASKAEFVPDSLSARYVFLLFTWVTSGRTEWSGAIFFLIYAEWFSSGLQGRWKLCWLWHRRQLRAKYNFFMCSCKATYRFFLPDLFHVLFFSGSF